MDARTVAAVAGVEVGTLNVWVQRNLIHGMKIGARGRQRDFDVDTATHIAVMAVLMQLGVGAPLASLLARIACDGKRFLFAKSPSRAVGTRNFRVQGSFLFNSCKSEAELSEAIVELENQYPGVEGYIVLNVERTAARTQQAEDEWQLRGKVNGLGLPVRLFSPSGERIEGGDATPSPKKTP
jgi:hypothetical protein